MNNVADYAPPATDETAPVLISTSECYHADVMTDTMEPRHLRGEALNVHPYVPPRMGEVHLFYAADSNGVALAELVTWDDANWYVRHLHPDPEKIMRLSRTWWPIAHVVVGTRYAPRDEGNEQAERAVQRRRARRQGPPDQIAPAASVRSGPFLVRLHGHASGNPCDRDPHGGTDERRHFNGIGR
jgi:hypothetical protein